MTLSLTVDARNNSVLTFVALGDDGHPVPVLPLLVETPEEQARMEEAKRLYERNKAERARSG